MYPGTWARTTPDKPVKHNLRDGYPSGEQA